MGIHANAKLGPAGRRELVRLMRAGSTERQAAACLSVARATAHRWSVREREATLEERVSGAWAMDASSRPHSSPRRTDLAIEELVVKARERTGWGPRLLAGETGVAHSTVHAILRRHGCSRAPRAARREGCRYEWPCPGDLLHMDVKRYPRFARPGHAVTGDRSRTTAEVRELLGHDYFHAVVDDHSRLAYGELLDDERAATRDHAATGDDRRRLELHPQPLAASAARRPRCSPDRHAALHASLEREGRALPPDNGTRVGQGHPLPQPPRPQPSTATLARALQRAQTPLRDRRPATHQPRSQPLRAGQLVSASFRPLSAKLD